MFFSTKELTPKLPLTEVLYTKMRCIYIPLSGRKVSMLESVRERHDELFDKVVAHITLVFPFEASF